MSKMSRRIVVDASVARSAGLTENPISLYCRRFLEAIHDTKHQVVMTDDIRSEWKKHQSRYSLTWLSAMQSRGRVINVSTSADDEKDLADRLDASTLVTDAQKDAARKDMLLLLAALKTDKLVSSRDDVVRAIFAVLCAELAKIASVNWVNPVVESEMAVEWIKAGARADVERSLGKFQPDA